MYRVIVHRRAARYLKKLSKLKKERIKNILSQLKRHPLDLSNVKSMIGNWEGYHRIRVGNIRIIFWIDEGEHIVYVDHIGPRGDVYK